MKIDDSSKLFKQFIKYKNKKLADLLPCDGVELFKEFYRDYRFEDAQTDKGDGLACYYGLSRDGGLKFEVGMVRVFRIIDQPHAGANRRLRLSFVYPFVETIVHTGLDKVKGSPEGNKLGQKWLQSRTCLANASIGA